MTKEYKYIDSQVSRSHHDFNIILVEKDVVKAKLAPNLENLQQSMHHHPKESIMIPSAETKEALIL